MPPVQTGTHPVGRYRDANRDSFVPGIADGDPGVASGGPTRTRDASRRATPGARGTGADGGATARPVRQEHGRAPELADHPGEAREDGVLVERAALDVQGVHDGPGRTRQDETHVAAPR